MTDYTKLSDGELLAEAGDDAAKWAEAFCQTFPEVDVDVALMTGWFANVIETAWDVRNKVVHIDPELREVVGRLAKSGLVEGRDFTVVYRDDEQ